MRDDGRLDNSGKMKNVENLGILEINGQNFLTDHIGSMRKSKESGMTPSFYPKRQQE